MNLKVNYDNLVRQLIPNHKRQPNRLSLLRAMAAPLGKLFAGFDAWRADVRMQFNMTGQVGVLEGYLRAKYGMASIKLYPFQDRGLSVGLREEGAGSAAAVGLTRDSGHPAAASLRGELEGEFDGSDFLVYVPVADPRTLEAIQIDIERYKQALVKYKIVQQ